MEAKVKEEVFEQLQGDRAYDQGNGASEQHLVACAEPRKTTGLAVPGYTNIIDLSSSSDSSDIEGEDGGATSGKRARDVGGDAEECLSFKRQNNGRAGEVVLPIGFLHPLAPQLPSPLPLLPPPTGLPAWKSDGACKQFWKAGDYEGAPCGDWDSRTGGMDHVRVHPKFLHSNATSHKWALGAFAELLDNALDEVCYGATYVNVDMLQNKKDGSPMLLFEDDGGGMNPEKMRQCMSLGYSAKSKMANTIGQYGNGFKTSTMRLGADVIVFSRCSGKDRSPTQSIGLLSYTFLRSTGKEDIVVPILDYERAGGEWNKIIRSGTADWKRNADTIVEWSPYASEAELLQQFYMMKDHGTRIVIFNLWEDDQGLLELDFESDKHDIQIRGVNREEKNIQMAKQYPNSKHFLTYRHSLRSYVSILYLRLPANFRIIIRGKDVEHHNVVNDMMMSQEVTYRPQASADGIPKDANMVAVVTVGFVKDAKAHIDVQGFNVYHKNRLIKPFWRVWNAAGSDGRGVIGVLEANFVEPAHDKQGFERTTVLARLESKLLNMQKTYWTSHCHKIGYAPRRNIKGVKGSSEYVPYGSAQPKGKTNAQGLDKSSLNKGGKFSVGNKYSNGHDSDKGKSRGTSSSSPEDSSDGDEMLNPTRVHGQSRAHGKTLVCAQEVSALGVKTNGSLVTEGAVDQLYDSQVLEQLRAENNELRERLSKKEEELFGDLVRDLQFEKDKRISIEKMLQEKEDKIEEMNREQESLIDIFSEERDRRDIEEENLRKKLKDASTTIKELLDKVKLLENVKPEKMRG